MNKKARPLLHKVLLLGSGPIQIGQAGEFDYSGSQAIKALKEENIKTVLVNPNIATIQTSDYMADKVYFLPLQPDFVEQVIARERPDGILLSFGGQTALNVGLALQECGCLERYGVQVLGTPLAAVRSSEDRQLFAQYLREIGLKVPCSEATADSAGALAAAERIGYPVMCRGAYALGGLGSGRASTPDELRPLADKAFSFTGQLLIEEFLVGWKELEYEVVRDRYDNCVVVCSMENIDAMGIHTGESVVVAPVQTLAAEENFRLRSLSIQVVRRLGIVGECNIQFAFNPRQGDYRIIEVNARLSRSSALASKATGYPLAFVAAKLALGYGLNEIANTVTGETSACCEPALDYVAIKYPRWDMRKFPNVLRTLGSEMKSVGEVMALGRTFEEALQKAIRMQNGGCEGLVTEYPAGEELERELSEPTERRFFVVAEALRRGYEVELIQRLTAVDPWFLEKMKNIVTCAETLRRHSLPTLPSNLLRLAKCLGFSDRQIARFTKSDENAVRQLRLRLGIIPWVKQIDTTAAEYPARTNYLYLTYNGQEDDLDFTLARQVVVLGSGPYCIGASVEFDWCAVNAVQALRRQGYNTLMINCNPETVSTDYDVCDRLYFEELNLERILDIVEKEKPLGIIVAMGGQIANNLVLPLHAAGIKILGTDPANIQRAEDRHLFSRLLDELGIDQPPWAELSSSDEALRFAAQTGYPVLIRPSYVLSGESMRVVRHNLELADFLQRETEVSREQPLVISKFLENAKEIEIDAVARQGELILFATSEHVENAGVHSGDATLVIPPQRTYLETLRRVKVIARKIARALKISGPFNIQFLARDNEVKVIECNLRASRSFPFVSKVLKVNMIELATRVIMGGEVTPITGSVLDLDYVGVKTPQFSFSRLRGFDPVTGVEMTSTGEVACLGDDFNEAFLKSLQSVGFRLPCRSIYISAASLEDQVELGKCLKSSAALNCHVYAPLAFAAFLREHGLPVETCASGGAEDDSAIDALTESGALDLVISIPSNGAGGLQDRDYFLRRRAIDRNIPLISNLQLAKRFLEAVSRTPAGSLKSRSWEEYGLANYLDLV